jgi:hypothetical protein
MVLGGRINHRALVQMIIRVIMHVSVTIVPCTDSIIAVVITVLTQFFCIFLLQKGPMPVGEVGKNLQIITGSDSLSRRLKEQFSGLKRAVEMSK